MAAYSFDGAFANVNSAIGDIGKRLEDRRTTDALLQAYDQSAGLGGPIAPQPRPLANLGASPANYFTQTRSAESSGNDAARNPASSATGRYQFLGGTWAGLMKSNPELGLTPDGRTDPQQQERAMRAFTAQNAQALQAKGIQPTDGNLYMAHFLGAGAAPNFISAVQQDPSVPAMSLVTPQVAAANKGVFFNPDGTPKSAGEVYQRMTGRFGNGATAIAQVQGGDARADVPAPGAVPTEGTMPQAAAPASPQNTNGQMIRALLANPGTRAAGLQLWQQVATGKQFGFQVVGDQLYRTDPRTGTVEPVGVSKPVTPVTVSEGQTLVDPRTGQVVYQGQAKEKSPVSVPEGGTLVNPQTGEVVYQGAVGNKARQDVATREQIANEQGYQGEDRKFFIANGKLPTAGEKTTEGQANAALYADRMKAADEILSRPEISESSLSRTQRTLAGVPVYGNSLVSPQFQMADQAQRDFINAVLRRESGAAISESEFDNARKQYFAQPGDGKDVLAQKARNRQTAIQGIGNAAGPTYAKRQMQQQPQYREGQRASNGQQTIVFRNGQWVPE
ncbi:hypothetical protein IED13_01065 [Bosea sp. SSUT16]|uniref:Transglycosylase SLT domain-containing protein n=1 Tax=Bosea spartocytisi TaxID=2773451 RepID=A0A927E4M3_9HYPH|nr:hypothetical protein [Bosea spartocytisi]MBD3844269.1 hypothetical protein [Bosea spartocytisi]MCT4470625.1 hypothetical protein [Bosea spartocytisi]